jgi:hypothetical protein
VKLNADIATEHIAGVLEELNKSVFQGNHEQDFLWRARVIVSSLEDLGIDVEYDTDVSSKIDEQIPTPKKLSLKDSFALYLADFKARMNK